MVSEAPPFWWHKADWRAWALYPASRIYAAAARHRLETAERHPVAAPVLCVGNFTVGGAGKTPVAITLARQAQKMNRKPGFLSRGYGGAVYAPHLVDAETDTVRHVGDEPLVLARTAPTVVAPNRVEGAELLITHGCDFIIMDDGFQSARVYIDYALIVVDTLRGIGNGHTMPGGPMRASLVDQMRHVDAIVRVGDGNAADEVVRQAARAGRRIYQARTKPCTTPFGEEPLLAFAGIGHPEKFFRTVEELGGRIVMKRGFSDHHLYTDEEARDLLRTAERQGARLVTTAKDAVRLRHGSEALGELAAAVTVVEIDTVFEHPETSGTIIRETLAAWQRRRERRS
ncbi:MAG: tetraacyldisaccharide 4'-kinase [Mesorhizobium sp.]|nr:tetraacyldisaccharide 4'-kinase [Mesorhizobium sp.]